MDEAATLKGLEAARRLAALSPQTQAKMDAWNADDVSPGLQVNSAFLQVGRAIASKRHPLSDRDLKRVFAEVERLLRSADRHVANAVATDLLEAIWSAARHSGFDLTTVTPHLGAEARRYLQAWDKFNGASTPGLKR